MNFRLVSKLLGMVAALIGVTMVFSLPWALPAFGHRTGEQAAGFDKLGFLALVGSITISFVVAGILYWAVFSTAMLFPLVDMIQQLETG